MKIRVIVNGVSYYTTRAAIKKQVSGDFSMQNTALFHALYMMGKNLGIGTTVTLYDSKVKRHSFDIQLSVMEK
jgi:hypothetical protein